MRIMVDLDNTLADYTHALRHHLRSTNVYGPLDGYALHNPCEYGLWRDPSWPFASYEEYADAHRSAVMDGLYLAEHPYPHAMRALCRLVEDGMICSSPPAARTTSISGRRSHGSTGIGLIPRTAPWSMASGSISRTRPGWMWMSPSRTIRIPLPRSPTGASPSSTRTTHTAVTVRVSP